MQFLCQYCNIYSDNLATTEQEHLAALLESIKLTQTMPLELPQTEGLDMSSKPEIPSNDSPQTPQRNAGLQNLRSDSNQQTHDPSLFLDIEPTPIAIEDPVISKSPPSRELKQEEPAPQPKQITIQISDTLFTIRTSTIKKYCRVLSNQFCSGRWNAGAVQNRDGVYIMEGNADMFTYLYDYMVYDNFPLFYEYHKGFDYAKYARLLAEAQYWQVDGVTAWINEKKFETAVEIKVTSIDSDGMVDRTLSAGVFHEFHPRVDIDKVYICPRRIPVHRGDKGRCSIACMNARGDDDDRYEEYEKLKTMRIEKKVIVHNEILKENRNDF